MTPVFLIARDECRRMQVLIELDRLDEALRDADVLNKIAPNPYVDFERGTSVPGIPIL
jgi:hypothetical protein